MKYAIVAGAKVEASPGERGLCPFCEGEVLAKCGQMVEWHWAHKSKKPCDNFSEGETPWHRQWKEGIPADQCEVTIVRDGVRHQADIVTHDGIVIEVQHSPISGGNIRKREDFYGKMVWVLNLTERSYDLSFSNSHYCNNYYNFQWMYARRSFASSRKPIFLDLGQTDEKLGKKHRLFQITRWPQTGFRGGEGVFLEVGEFKTRILNGSSPDLSELFNHFDDRVCLNCEFNRSKACSIGLKHPYMRCVEWQKVADEHFQYVR